jgi:hypothetical protein
MNMISVTAIVMAMLLAACGPPGTTEDSSIAAQAISAVATAMPGSRDMRLAARTLQLFDLSTRAHTQLRTRRMATGHFW